MVAKSAPAAARRRVLLGRLTVFGPAALLRCTGFPLVLHGCGALLFLHLHCALLLRLLLLLHHPLARAFLLYLLLARTLLLCLLFARTLLLCLLLAGSLLLCLLLAGPLLLCLLFARTLLLCLLLASPLLLRLLRPLLLCLLFPCTLLLCLLRLCTLLRLLLLAHTLRRCVAGWLVTGALDWLHHRQAPTWLGRTLRLTRRPSCRREWRCSTSAGMRKAGTGQFARTWGRLPGLVARRNRMCRVPGGRLDQAAAAGRRPCWSRWIAPVRRSDGRVRHGRNELHALTARCGRRSRHAQLLYLCGRQWLAMLAGNDFLARGEGHRLRRRCVAGHDGPRERLVPLELGRTWAGTAHAETGCGWSSGRARGDLGARELRDRKSVG